MEDIVIEALQNYIEYLGYELEEKLFHGEDNGIEELAKKIDGAKAALEWYKEG